MLNHFKHRTSALRLSKAERWVFSNLASHLGTWWADKGNGFAFIPAVNAEIFVIHGDEAVARVKLAHADEAKIG